MTEALLQTKLNIPQIQAKIVPRPRLFEKLNQGVGDGRKLILVSAPAGFGKTTLVVDWLARLTRDEPALAAASPQAVWISLDESDNDIYRFFSYINEAFQRLDQVGTSTLGLLHSPLQPSHAALVTTMINDLLPVTQPLILVLEDYHVINDGAIHEALALFIEHMPGHLQLVITSRVDPLLPLPKLRARGQMTEVRTDDLRFSVEESAAFLEKSMGLQLTAEDISALEERTEGWIAGLQMAALSMQGMKDPDRKKEFVADFTGTHRYIFDYLTDEVLRQRPPGTRTFLLQTSILDRFCAPLCDAILEDDDGEMIPPSKMGSQSILEQLEAANLFVIPLDAERKWYRYHHLFAQLLRLRLGRSKPERISILQGRASRWYESQGDIKMAINYSLAADDPDRAAYLLDSIALRFINQAEIRELLIWINRIPEENRQPQARLNLAHAWASMFAHNYADVEPLLKLAEGHLTRPGDLPPDLPPAQLAASINTVRAYVATRSGRLEESIELSEQALLILGKESELPTPDLRGPITLNLGITYQRLDKIEAAEENFQEALKRNREADRGFATLATYGTLLRLNIARGDLAKAGRIGEGGLAWSARFVEKVGYPLRAESEIRREMACLYYQQNKLDESRKHQIKGLELALWGSPTVAAELYHLAFYWHLAKDDINQAKVCHEECERLAQSEFLADHKIEAARAVDRLLTLWRIQGDPPYLLTSAKEWAMARSFEPENSIPYPHEYEYSVYARLLLADGRANEALKVAEQLSQSARAAGRFGDQVGHLINKVKAIKALDRIDDALDTLQEAVILAELGGNIRTFIDGGVEISELLTMLKPVRWDQSDDKKRFDAYFEALLDAVQRESTHRHALIDQRLTEQLSKRELEVLRLLSSHLTGPEIAQELFISVNTYKSHTKNIYSKLGVGSRAEAVNRAKDLGLL